MSEGVLCIPYLGYQFPNFTYSRTGEKTTSQLAQRGSDLEKGTPIFRWQYPVYKSRAPEPIRFIASMFSRENWAKSELLSPVKGTLLDANFYESFFSNNSPTTKDVLREMGPKRVGNFRDIACFIAVSEYKALYMRDFYAPFIDEIYDIIRNAPARMTEGLNEIAYEEFNPTKEMLCPFISLDEFQAR